MMAQDEIDCSEEFLKPLQQIVLHANNYIIFSI